MLAENKLGDDNAIEDKKMMYREIQSMIPMIDINRLVTTTKTKQTTSERATGKDADDNIEKV